MARSWRDVRAEAVASGRVDPARADAARRRMKAMEHAHTLAKKHIVDAAVREYIDHHRQEIYVGVKDALSRLDGSNKSAVSLLTGMSADRLDELGGISS